MPRDRREVLFFGSVALRIIGHDIHDEAIAEQLERQNAFIKLRTTVTAAHADVEEGFGLVSTSALYEIQASDAHSSPLNSLSGSRGSATRLASSQRHRRHPSTPLERATFLPLLLKRTTSAAATSSVKEEREEAAAADVEGLGRAWNSPSAESDGVAQMNAGGISPEQSAACLTGASVRIEVDVSRSGSRAAPVGMHEAALPSLSHLARHDICTVVRVPLLTRAIQTTATAETGVEAVGQEPPQQRQQSHGGASAAASLLGTSNGDTGVSAEAALNVYVLVRVISLAEKVRLAVEADEAVSAFLQPQPDAASPLRFGPTCRGDAPYGAMPLTELYKHYKHFFGFYRNVVIKHTDAAMQRLAAAPQQREAAASYPHRWNTLTELDLRPVLLGEDGAAPLLLAVAHCTNLRTVYADGNHLGDATCGRLVALLRHHRYLSSVTVSHNAIHEAGGVQLVRLLRANLRITTLTCEGNYFSGELRQRIEGLVAQNRSVIANDPLNIFSRSYTYLTSLSCLPEVTQRQALRMWAMLSAAPVGDVDVMVRNATTSSQHTIGDSHEVAKQRAKQAAQARETFSLVPPAAVAPLLNEVMRTVSTAISRIVPDPLIRSLFTDFETVLLQQQQQKEKEREEEAKKRLSCPADTHEVNANKPSAAESPSAAEAATPSSLPSEVSDVLGGPHTPHIDTEKLYARSFLRLVVTAFRGLMLGTSWGETATVLESVGRTHRDLGVMPEDYWLAVHVFMNALRICCGAESYDREHASSFLAILALAVRTAAGVDVSLD